MRVNINKENQSRLRVFIAEVCKHNRVGIYGLARILGMKRSMLQEFMSGHKDLGDQSVIALVSGFSLPDETTDALLNPAAELTTFPAPERISLELPANNVYPVRRIMVGVEEAQTILNIVRGAGKPLPLSLIARLLLS